MAIGLLSGLDPYDEGYEPEVQLAPQQPPQQPAGPLPGGTPGIMPQQAAPAADRSPMGLLGQAAKWALSPAGRLAIGTTIRAGDNPNAFADQRAIINRWDTNRKEDEAADDLAKKNEALNEAFITDENGKVRYDREAHRAAMARLKVKGDLAGQLKAAKEIKDLFGASFTPVGKHVLREEDGQAEWFDDPAETPQEKAEREAEQEERDARIAYYKARSEAVPEDVETRRYRATHPGTRGGGKPAGPPPDFSKMTPQELSAYIAKRSGRK